MMRSVTGAGGRPSCRPANRHHFAAAAIGAALLAPFSPAQQVVEGHRLTVAGIPTSAVAAAESVHGMWSFDGNQLLVTNRAGVGRVSLQLPYWTWGTFLLPLQGDSVLLGEGQGRLWRATPSGAGHTRPLVTIPFHYDATLYDADTVLVSARTGGWTATDNDLLAVDLTTGDVQPFALVGGASGPLAIGPSGDLFYATASSVYPTPPGSVQILRFARATVDAALAAHTVLTQNDAIVAFAGLDAAADIAFDSDGDLFYTDFVNGTVGELHDLEGPTPTLRPPLIDYTLTPLSPSTLQFVDGPGPGSFEPMQPPGGRLLLFATDYFAIAELHDVGALRPTLTAPNGPIATGPFALHLDAGPQNGAALLLLGQGSAAGEASLTLVGFEQPLWLDGTTASSVTPSLTLLDAAGTATLPLHNPGFAVATAMTAQCVCLSTTGKLGSTTPMTLSLGL